LSKLIRTAEEFVGMIKNAKGTIDLGNEVTLSIHKMTSKVIWGEDVNEKIAKIDYIDIETGAVSKLNLQQCYSKIMNCG